VRAAARVDLRTTYDYNAEFVLSRCQQALVWDGPLEIIVSNVLLGPEVNFDGQIRINVPIQLGLDWLFPLTVDEV
jgi:hypothetical protein